MSRRLFCCVFVIGTALSLVSQRNALPPASSNSTTTFSSNSELVLVPVQVLDHYGQPIHGLTQQDFLLKSDGNPQHIGLFQEIQSAPMPAPVPAPLLVHAAAKTPTKYSNVHAEELPQQLLIIAIDILNTPAQLQGWTRQELIKYLRSNPPLQPTELVAITAEGLREIHPFTTDSAALIQAIGNMQTSLTAHESQLAILSTMDKTDATSFLGQGGSVGSYNSVLRQVQERKAENKRAVAGAGGITLRSFEEMAWAYSGIPGRKTVLWLTSGFPLTPEVTDGPPLLASRGGAAAPNWVPSYELLPAFQRAFTAMNKSNIVVYPVDVNGLPIQDMWEASMPGAAYIHPGYGNVWRSWQLPSEDTNRDGMKELAHRTGGKTCTAGNSLQYCLNQAVSESSDYYLLGFYVPQQRRKLGWHKLKVTVNVDHGEVRARSTYYLRPTGTPPEQEQEDDLRSAINSSVEYTGISFSVEPGKRTAGAKGGITFKVSVPANTILLVPGQDKLSFDVIAIPLSRTGQPIGKQSRVVQLNMPPATTQKVLVKGWNLINGIGNEGDPYAVKVVVRDNMTGRIGSVVFPVPTAAPSGS